MSTITIKKTSVTSLDVDAIVNAANDRLEKGGGVCGAIFREAGSKELAAACRKIGTCKTGSAVITPGFRLKAKYVIHAVGPIWKDGTKGEPTQLYDVYKNSLELARKNNIHSIGFPLISAGIYGYPLPDAWRKALRASATFIKNNPDYDIDITFAVLDERILQLGLQTLDNVVKETGIIFGLKKTFIPLDVYAKMNNLIKRNLNLLKAIAYDENLSDWFKGYNPYEPIQTLKVEDSEVVRVTKPSHEGLCKIIDSELFNKAYDLGVVVSNYQEIIDEYKLDTAMICEPTTQWASMLTKEQIIACIAFHFRRDHFNEGSFYSCSIGEGWLIILFEAYLAL